MISSLVTTWDRSIQESNLFQIKHLEGQSCRINELVKGSQKIATLYQNSRSCQSRHTNARKLVRQLLCSYKFSSCHDPAINFQPLCFTLIFPYILFLVFLLIHRTLNIMLSKPPPESYIKVQNLFCQQDLVSLVCSLYSL